jgi:hypothetical protein
MPGSGDGRAPAPARACRRRIARNDVADRNKRGRSRAFSAQSIFSRTHKGRTAAPLPSAPPHDSVLRGPPLVAGASGIPDSTVTEPDSQVSEGLAAQFNGPVEFNGNLNCAQDIVLTNPGQDCAEDFDVALDESIDPGTVMVLGEGGALRTGSKAYDKRVAGIVSGAGDFRPAIVLGKQNHALQRRAPIALMGKVYGKVDASYGAIEVGDLLTTSTTHGHAMKADDPHRAFGSIIGKALAGC